MHDTPSRCASVRDALTDTAGESANLKLRAELIQVAAVAVFYNI